jgi:hypothetical protein
MKKTRLKAHGSIDAITEDGEYALTIHHSAGLTIGLDHEEMVNLQRVIAAQLQQELYTLEDVAVVLHQALEDFYDTHLRDPQMGTAMDKLSLQLSLSYIREQKNNPNLRGPLKRLTQLTWSLIATLPEEECTELTGATHAASEILEV